MKKILIAKKKDLSRHYVKNSLELHNFQNVEQAYTTEGLLQKLENLRLDLVIIDIGFFKEIHLERIKKIHIKKRTRFILLNTVKEIDEDYRKKVFFCNFHQFLFWD